MKKWKYFRWKKDKKIYRYTKVEGEFYKDTQIIYPGNNRWCDFSADLFVDDEDEPLTKLEAFMYITGIKKVDDDGRQ